MLTLFSPAKVNLTLAVMAPREDGFHALDSLVTPLTLGDTVRLEKADQTHLTMESETVDLSAMPIDCEKNLAVRAVRLLEHHCQLALPTAIHILKRIPLGGGLGGGSSNAATVLRGMNTLWALGLSQEELCLLGAQLGSDVPLFVLDGTVRMRGRGEWVERVALPNAKPLTLLLVNDGTHCPTPQVYRALDNFRKKKNICLTNKVAFCNNMRLSLQKGDSNAVSQWLFNDLQAPCFELFPHLTSVVQAMQEAGCIGVTLSGSGATVFGLLPSPEEGERALRHPALAGKVSACVQTLPDGVMAAHGPLTPIVMVRIHVGQPFKSCSSV